MRIHYVKFLKKVQIGPHYIAEGSVMKLWSQKDARQHPDCTLKVMWDVNSTQWFKYGVDAIFVKD